MARRQIGAAESAAADATTKGYVDAQIDAMVNAAQLRLAPAGTKGQTADRRWLLATAIPALTSGTLRLTAMWLPQDTVVTSITYLCGATATGVTNRWFSLFNSSRVLLRTTADNSAVWNAGAGRTLALSTSYTIPSDGVYYIGICEVATTPSGLRGLTTGSHGVSLTPALNGDSSTGLTDAASTPSTAATITANGSLPYGYVT